MQLEVSSGARSYDVRNRCGRLELRSKDPWQQRHLARLYVYLTNTRGAHERLDAWLTEELRKAETSAPSPE